jgi:hypothetical protein
MFVKIKEWWLNTDLIVEIKDIEKVIEGTAEKPVPPKFLLKIEMNNQTIKGYIFDTREEAEKTIKKIVIPNGAFV